MNRRSPLLRRSASEQGYAMLIAMLLLAILAVVGASTLQVAGIDQRIALQNRKHMLVLNTSAAGLEHARDELSTEDPVDEGFTDTGPDFVTATEAETDFGGLTFNHNLGVYWVDAVYMRCGNPPPGYSTELGQNKFRADYWQMTSTARMQDTSYQNVNESQATTVSVVRKVKFGTCKIR